MSEKRVSKKMLQTPITGYTANVSRNVYQMNLGRESGVSNPAKRSSMKGYTANIAQNVENMNRDRKGKK